MIKSVIVGTLVLFILSTYGLNYDNTINRPGIEIDGKKIRAYASIEGDSIYLPLEDVCKALGYNVDKSQNDEVVSVTKPGKSILIDLKNYKITVNDHEYYITEEYADIVFDESEDIENSTYMKDDFFSDNLGLKISLDKKSAKVIVKSIKENPIFIRTVKETNETDRIKITLKFPQIEGLSDKSAEDRINSILRGAAEAARDEGQKNAEYFEEGTDLSATSPNKHEVYFDYRMKYNQNGLLSVVLFNYQYTGGAHGITVQSSYTFDLKTGEEYKFKDLMKADADYVTFISNVVKQKIDERIKIGLLPNYLLTPFTAIRDDQDFYLSNNGVVVYFQQYEYFPYAAGIQEFVVDYTEFSNMLKPEFSFLYK
ncbi:MAG TPA: DUF4163 domain-containing protein [Clostridiaceae bacterium]|nr:DUF4163 domain-containing protein [Clostridiaceae bacterium]HHV99072.1 DUF4163 domain-containing protein [Clostridiaceae bacterium]